MSGLPPGFTLDAPPAGLPQGFKLDAPTERKPYNIMENRPWGTGIMEGLHKFADFAGEKINDYGAKVLEPQVAAGLGAATKAGIEVGPAMAMGATAGVGAGAAAVKPAMQGLGEWLMKTAVKPIWEDQRSGRAAKALATMLERGYSPTRGGVDAMSTRIADLKAAQRPITDSSTQAGNADRIISGVDDVEREIGKGTMRTDPLRSTDRVRQEFLTHPEVAMSAEYGSGVPVNVLQAMKERNYKTLSDSAYGAKLAPDAGRDALKALNAKIAREIEMAEPGVVPLNREMSELLNAKKVAERRAMMQSNNNPASLGVSLASAANNPMLAVGMYANSSAAVKAALARMLYTGGKGTPEMGGVSGAALAALLQQDEGQ